MSHLVNDVIVALCGVILMACHGMGLTSDVWKRSSIYFLAHPYSGKSAAHRIVTVSCILCSLKTFNDIKFYKIESTPFITWLTSNKVCIEADALGHKAT